ncbi:MAG: hypothetical protein ACOCVB_00760 [Bacillota bacterium]
MVLIPDYVETQEPLEIWIRSQLKNDTELNELIDNAYPEWADKDAEFPYIVYRIEVDSQTEEGAVSQATLYLGLWDHNQLKQRILRMRGHVLRLFDRTRVYLEGVGLVRIKHNNGGSIPEDTKNIWHREEIFDLRFSRTIEIEKILDSKE